MARKLQIVDYDPKWPELYRSEETLLKDTIGNYIIDIQHIGSTSVPELGAKPIIDIMIGVENLGIADQYCVDAIVKLGYEYVSKYEDELPFRRYFRRVRDDGEHTHHIHLVEITHDWWERHIIFRDYLRKHPQDRIAYDQLKRKLTTQFTDVHDYTDAKTEFIQSVEKKAFHWKQNQAT